MNITATQTLAVAGIEIDVKVEFEAVRRHGNVFITDINDVTPVKPLGDQISNWVKGTEYANHDQVELLRAVESALDVRDYATILDMDALSEIASESV